MLKCNQYNVVFYGDLTPDKTREQVRNSLTLHAMSFADIGTLNLLLRRHPGLLVGRSMFLVNGLVLFGSGGWNLMEMLRNSLRRYGDLGIRLEIGRFESSITMGGVLLVWVLQIGVGLYGLDRFRQYASTQQLLSRKGVLSNGGNTGMCMPRW